MKTDVVASHYFGAQSCLTSAISPDLEGRRYMYFNQLSGQFPCSTSCWQVNGDSCPKIIQQKVRRTTVIGVHVRGINRVFQKSVQKVNAVFACR